MPIDMNCPGCGKKLRLADEHAGKTGRCPACQATFSIPAAGQAPAPQPTGPAASPFSPSYPDQAPAFPPQPSAGQHAETSSASPFAEPKPQPFETAVNPYASPKTLQPAYAPPPAANPGETFGIISIVLGVVAIISGGFSICCCLGWIVTFPAGIVGLVLAFQAPPQQRMIGIILNSLGMGLVVVGFLIGIAAGVFQNLQ